MRTPFIEGQQAQQVRNELAKVAPLDEARTSVQSVSPTIASQTASTALLATVVASLAIMIFIWWSFRKAEHSFRYSVCAIIAMIHDVLVAAGLTALFSILFNWEIDALFLTAMLTVIGFSVQDTIVVYDRIRENLTRRRGETFEMIVGRSVVETLHRSLTISLINMLVMVSLLIFGGASIKQFIAVLLIGLVSGTYSSVFNAVPLVVAWFERDIWGNKSCACCSCCREMVKGVGVLQSLRPPCISIWLTSLHNRVGFFAAIARPQPTDYSQVLSGCQCFVGEMDMPIHIMCAVCLSG